MYRLLILLALLPTTAQAEPTEIIHILNSHYVTREDFAKDLDNLEGDHANSTNVRDVYRPQVKEKNTLPLRFQIPARLQGIIDKSRKELDEKYSPFLKDVKAVQKQQVAVLRDLIKKHKLKSVYLEGVTEKNYKSVLKTIETIKNDKKAKPENAKKLKLKIPDGNEFEGLTFDSIPEEDEFYHTFIAAINEAHLLELGAAGQLVVKGELEKLLPVENSKAFEAANPFQPDGTVVFDKQADEAREDAMVRNLLQGDGVVVIVLGGTHDLSDNLKRIAKGVKYTRVGVPKYKEMMGD